MKDKLFYAFTSCGIIGYFFSRINYDYHWKYYYYIYLPSHMRAFDLIKDYIGYKYAIFLSYMPFGGDIPDISEPENFNKFRREVKNRIFLTELREAKRKEMEEKLKLESAGK